MILLNEDTKCLVQGITGKQGSFHTEQMLKYNTNIVAGLTPGKGGQIVRSAGMEARLMAKEGRYATIKLPSGEMRLVLSSCKATIGQVGNLEHEIVSIGKAGRTRHKGIRPTVRGSVMNPCDHPHGGGEGKCPVGRKSPLTPWGKPALGKKTRNTKKQSSKLIIKRAN